MAVFPHKDSLVFEACVVCRHFDGGKWAVLAEDLILKYGNSRVKIIAGTAVTSADAPRWFTAAVKFFRLRYSFQLQALFHGLLYRTVIFSRKDGDAAWAYNWEDAAETMGDFLQKAGMCNTVRYIFQKMLRRYCRKHIVRAR
jgi:hypothetical protein